jgi:hypothetical protein
MNNLEQLATRLDNLQTSLSLIKYDLENELKKQETPKYELSDLMREIIEQEMDNFIRDEIIGGLTSDYTGYTRGDGFSIEVNVDLQEVVEDQLDSSHRLASKFIDKLINELDSLKEQEQDETTEQGDEQHQDC